VTAALTELDTDRGLFRRISAGHPGELLFRDGKLIKTLTAPTAMPLGLGHLGTGIPTVEEEALQPAISSCSTPTASPRLAQTTGNSSVRTASSNSSS
jgi:hypothetical protein